MCFYLSIFSGAKSISLIIIDSTSTLLILHRVCLSFPHFLKAVAEVNILWHLLIDCIIEDAWRLVFSTEVRLGQKHDQSSEYSFCSTKTYYIVHACVCACGDTLPNGRAPARPLGGAILQSTASAPYYQTLSCTTVCFSLSLAH